MMKEYPEPQTKPVQELMTPNHTVEIQGDLENEPWERKVIIDGVDLSEFVQSVAFGMTCDDLSQEVSVVFNPRIFTTKLENCCIVPFCCNDIPLETLVLFLDSCRAQANKNGWDIEDYLKHETIMNSIRGYDGLSDKYATVDGKPMKKDYNPAPDTPQPAPPHAPPPPPGRIKKESEI